MQSFRKVVIIAVMALTAVSWARAPQNPSDEPAEQNAAIAAQSPSAQASLNILKPRAGEKIRQNSVVVSYALANPGASAAGDPNYQLRLDAQDPVTTTATEYSFTGLQPGAHTISVQLVDANGTPISGAQASVQFSVLRETSRKYGPQAIAAALRLDPQTDIRVQPAAQPQPVTTNPGALPLLSVIGFGVLLGGIASAMKTRR
jgi:hypothetical protein